MEAAAAIEPVAGRRLAGPLLEGALLLALLAALAAGLVVTRPGGAPEGPGPAVASSASRAAPGAILAGARPATHLVILVDESVAADEAVLFSRHLDAGTGWIVSVEVVEATDALVRGLDEALTAAAVACPTSGCPALAVLDLRTPGDDPQP